MDQIAGNDPRPANIEHGGPFTDLSHRRGAAGVALLFERRIAPADDGAAVWNENSGTRNSHLCRNK
jgi:hypothetical protein